MIKILFTILCLLGYSSDSLAKIPEVVIVGERQWVGDPDTLNTLDNMSVGGHELSINRWQSSQGIDAVMRKLTEQVPADTIAWSDGEMMHMLWTTQDQSHVLILTPANENRVDIYMSSFRLSKKSVEGALLAFAALKQSLSDRRFRAELMMDVQDRSSGAEAAALMYVSSQPIKDLDEGLRRMLKSFGWSVIEDSHHQQSVFKASSIDAVRPGAVLRMNLMDDGGRTFLYINLSGGIQP